MAKKLKKMCPDVDSEYFGAEYLGDAENPYRILSRALNDEDDYDLGEEYEEENGCWPCDMDVDERNDVDDCCPEECEGVTQLLIRSIKIHPDCEKIAEDAFACSNLYSIELEGPVEFEKGCFDDCEFFKEIYFAGEKNEAKFLKEIHKNNSGIGELQVECDDGVFTLKPKTKRVRPADITVLDLSDYQDAYLCDTKNYINLEELIIPDCVTEIEDESFYDLPMLEHVKLGSGIERIGDMVFDAYHDNGYNADLEIEYNGTKADWAKVEHDDFSGYSRPEITIKCLDGTIKIEGSY